MFRTTWSWSVPVASALGVGGFVLATTPPGLGSMGTLLFSTGADPAAYAAGAAASLALVALAAVGALCALADVVVRRGRRR